MPDLAVRLGFRDFWNVVSAAPKAWYSLTVLFLFDHAGPNPTRNYSTLVFQHSDWLLLVMWQFLTYQLWVHWGKKLFNWTESSLAEPDLSQCQNLASRAPVVFRCWMPETRWAPDARRSRWLFWTHPSDSFLFSTKLIWWVPVVPRIKSSVYNIAAIVKSLFN